MAARIHQKRPNVGLGIPSRNNHQEGILEVLRVAGKPLNSRDICAEINRKLAEVLELTLREVLAAGVDDVRDHVCSEAMRVTQQQVTENLRALFDADLIEKRDIEGSRSKAYVINDKGRAVAKLNSRIAHALHGVKRIQVELPIVNSSPLEDHTDRTDMQVDMPPAVA